MNEKDREREKEKESSSTFLFELDEDESTLGTCRRNVSININNTAFWRYEGGEGGNEGRRGRLLRKKEAYRGRWSLIEFKIHANSWIMRPLGALERLSCGEGSRHKGPSEDSTPFVCLTLNLSRRKRSFFFHRFPSESRGYSTRSNLFARFFR